MTTIRQRLQHPDILLAPGVYDALSSLIAEQSGFESVYISGASVAYTLLGRSDVGLTTYTEVNERLAQIRDRIALPIFVDADTGFGNALNVERTVRGFERSGANVIQLEDQGFPKRCGHLDGKTVVSTQEMVGKIKAALDARHSSETLIMARTDALAIEGFEATLDRAEAYLAAGADILFIEAVRSEEQMREVNERFRGRAPLLANMVEGGKTPIRTTQQLQAFYSSLKANGHNGPFADRMLDFNGLNDVIGTPALLERGRCYELGCGKD